MKETRYLELLLEGLTSQYKLKPIAAKAWEANKDIFHPIGRLDLEHNLFYNQKKASNDDWENENSFVLELAKKHPSAGKYTAFYLAEVWGSRRAVEQGSTHAVFDDNRIKAAKNVCDNIHNGAYYYVKGAITGIQSYIYDNVKSEQSNEGKKVSRRLRGRSFLVAVLGDMVAEKLVETLGLEQANILFVGGGHFNLLIPKTDKTVRQLKDEIWEINSGLLQEFGLKLGLVIATATVDESEFNNFGPIFQKANDQLEKAKQRRFEGHLSEVFFEKKFKKIVPHEVMDQKEKEKLLKKDKEDKEEEKMETAGRWIPKASFILEIKGQARKVFHRKTDKILQLESLDTVLVFILEDNWDKVLDKLNRIEVKSAESIKLHRLNSTRFLPADKDKRDDFLVFPLAYGYRMLGQYAPAIEEGKEKDMLMDLSDLAALDEQRKEPLKYPKLAAMRLDIDDLGALFAYGLGDQTNLNDTLALSREMQLFFGGYFNVLAQKHHLYIVYSGGDDAFVLGSWINVLNFAYRLKQKFSQFTVDNKEMTFSAGIFMANPKYPIARLANDAAEEESRAKKYCLPDNISCKEEGEEDKDAIRVFGHTLTWSRFMDMMTFSDELLEQIGDGNGKIRRSAVQHLLGVIQSAHKAKDQEFDHNLSAKDKKEAVKQAIHFEFYRHLGRLHALITRRGISDNQIIKQLLQEMSDFEVFQDYLLPLHYVLYKTR